jgi:hypothetical protein
MKKCTKCGVLKELSEFVTLKKSKDGKGYYCKKCKSIYMHEYKKAYRKRGHTKSGKRFKEYFREYYANNTAEHIATVLKYQKTEKGKSAMRRKLEKYHNKHPHRKQVNTNLNIAVKAGLVIRGVCEVCKGKTTHGHHDDYNKQLEVRWLCPKHHSAWHKVNKPVDI